MNNGEVGFLNFPALLHLAQKRGVFLAAGNQVEAGGFAVKTADERKELAGELFAEPVDEGECSIRPSRMDQPAGWFVHDQEPGIGAEDGGLGHGWFEIGHGRLRVGVPTGFQF